MLVSQMTTISKNLLHC